MKRWTLWLPLLLFLGFVGLALFGLTRDKDDIVRSQMIGKPLPALTLPPAASDRPGLNLPDLADGKPRLLNIFASWCVPCAAESPQLEALRQRGVAIEGVAIRDARKDVDAFLARNGNPYDRIGLDARSEVQFNIGSSGVPETFVIDGKGVIRHQHVGVIMDDDISVLLEQLEAAR